MKAKLTQSSEGRWMISLTPETDAESREVSKLSNYVSKRSMYISTPGFEYMNPDVCFNVYPVSSYD